MPEQHRMADLVLMKTAISGNAVKLFQVDQSVSDIQIIAPAC
jgi:hypothetical protein